jgi:hypothetical protein
MTVSLFDLRRMDFARKLPERARLMRDDMLRADAAVAAVSAATALIPFRGGTPGSSHLMTRHSRRTFTRKVLTHRDKHDLFNCELVPTRTFGTVVSHL